MNMRVRILRTVALLSLVLIAGRSFAQDKPKPLTNADVISMVKAGLPEDTVINAIASQPSNFDISAMGLLDLKKQGASAKIMDAMVAAAGKAQSNTPAPQTPASSSEADAASGGEIPPGTTVTVRTIDTIDSQTAEEGQVFKASLDQPIEVGGATLVPAGADVTLKLVKVKQSGHFTGTTDLTVAIDALMLNGNRIAVETGEVTNSSSGRGKRSAIMVGGGTAAGALLGGLLAGKKGAMIGAGLGAASGAAAQVMTKGQKVVIPAETRLTFNVTAPAKP
jgi:hypothetical protein